MKQVHLTQSNFTLTFIFVFCYADNWEHSCPIDYYNNVIYACIPTVIFVILDGLWTEPHPIIATIKLERLCVKLIFFCFI